VDRTAGALLSVGSCGEVPDLEEVDLLCARQEMTRAGGSLELRRDSRG
jgi:hypothetical protein